MGILKSILKPMITPGEITALLTSNRTDIVGDALNINFAIGQSNTTPNQPSTSGVRGLFDGGATWTQKTGCNTARSVHCAPSLTGNYHLASGGYTSGPATGATERYSDGETYFKGFALK